MSVKLMMKWAVMVGSAIGLRRRSIRFGFRIGCGLVSAGAIDLFYCHWRLLSAVVYMSHPLVSVYGMSRLR